MPGNPNHSTKACVHSNADTFSCGNASQDGILFFLFRRGSMWFVEVSTCTLCRSRYCKIVKNMNNGNAKILLVCVVGSKE